MSEGRELQQHIRCLRELRTELVSAATREADRRRAHDLRRARVHRAIRAGVLVLAALALIDPSPARADIRIEVADGRAQVTLVDQEQDAARIEVELRAAGLEASVTSVPVGPSAVGRFVGLAAASAGPRTLERSGTTRTAFSGFSVPVGWPGSIYVLVGRSAQPGERYAAFTDALAPGEPLACRALVGRPATLAATLVRQLPVEVRFQPRDPGPGGPVALETDDVGRSPYAGWIVAAADALSQDEVVVWLEPTGSIAPPAEGCR